VLATRNAGKVRELRAVFADAGIDVIDLREAGIAESAAEDELESFVTFEENALAKARYFAERAGGRPVVADDSGLEVLALAGAPGVRSKRWSGRTDLEGAALDHENNVLLMARLQGVSDRRARFVCAAAWCPGDAGGDPIVVRGEIAGTIVDRASGSHGFGYDPHFLSSELGVTLGEATIAEKQLVSHRGRAMTALTAAVRGRRGSPHS
jgi:XTP/dITP diphosphohydrolase